MDNGPHAVDLARFLLGEVRLAGVNLRGGNRPRVEEEASLRLENQAGVPISIELSWRRSLSQTFLQISGEEGILSVRWDGIFWQHGGDEEQIPNSRYDKNRAFARQLEMFLNDISAEIPLHNEAPWQDEDGLRAVEIIVAAYEMAKSERSQSVL